MINAQKFSDQEMFEIGQRDEKRDFCHFDFSFINSNYYDSFFHSLPKLIFKKIKMVKFSCDRRYEINDDTDQIVNYSIAVNQSKYMQYLMKILRIILPKTNTLVSLELSNINIPEIHQIVLFQEMAKCKSLKQFITNNIPITNNSFAILLKLISPYQYEVLSFNQTNLSSLVFMRIYKFLKKKSSDRWKLKIFDVRGSDFTDKEFQKINELLERHQSQANANEEEINDDENDAQKTVSAPKSGVFKDDHDTDRDYYSNYIKKEYHLNEEEEEEEEEEDN